ncbi:Solute carrier 26 [Nowakowskiella sp. JEL0407]|nr:Solute carrier 26 [Nowakowskiella sp. JEL0407]
MPPEIESHTDEIKPPSFLDNFKNSFHNATENLRLLAGETLNEIDTWKKIRVWIFHIFPISDQLRPGKYNVHVFIEDFLAAVAVTAMIIPQSLAYGSLARIPAVQSFISATIPLIIYAIFGSGRQLALGPEALTSVLIGVYAEKEVLAYGGTVSDVASTLTLLVGIFCLLIAVIQAGFIDNILAGYLLTGFVSGIGTLIMIEQVPGLVGVHLEANANAPALETFYNTINNIHKMSLLTFLISLSNIAFLFAAKSLKYKYGPKLKTTKSGKYLLLIPELFILVVFMTMLSGIMDLQNNGVQVIGDIGQFSFRAPQFHLDRVRRLTQPALIITIMGFVVTQVVNRTFGMLNNYTVSKHRELVAVSFANLVSAGVGGSMVCGSLPRSRVLANSGARTMLCNLIVGIFTIIALSTVSPLLHYLPKATLESIVFVAAYGLIDWGEIKFLFKLRSTWEIAQFLATFAITIGSSISDGVIFCFLLAALVIVRRTTKLEMRIMGRVTVYTHFPNLDKQQLVFDADGQEKDSTEDLQEIKSGDINPTSSPTPVQYRFVPVDEYPDAQFFSAITIISIKGPLLFFNANRIPREIDAMVHKQRKIRYLRQREDRDGSPSHRRIGTETKYVSMTLNTLEIVTQQKTIPAGEQDEEKFLPDNIQRNRARNATTALSENQNMTTIFDFSASDDLDSAASYVFASAIKNIKGKVLLASLSAQHLKLFSYAGILNFEGDQCNVFETVGVAVRSIISEEEYFSESLS